MNAKPHIRVVVLRIRQTQGLDITIASLLESSQRQLESAGKTLLILGLRPDAMQLFEKTGIAIPYRTGRISFRLNPAGLPPWRPPSAAPSPWQGSIAAVRTVLLPPT